MSDDVPRRLMRLENHIEVQDKRVSDRLLDVETRVYFNENEQERRHQELLATVERTINGRIKKVEGDTETLERMMRELIASRIEVLEAKNAIVRTVVYGMCGIILAFVLNWMLADNFNGPRFPPQLAPASSQKEIRQ